MLQTTRHMLKVRDERELRARAADQARKRGVPVVTRPTAVTPYVNHGRWVADCVCGGGVACDPGMAVAVCFACQSPDALDEPAVAVMPVDWSGVDVPGVTAALVERPRATTRNWRPGETPAALRAEMKAHAREKA